MKHSLIRQTLLLTLVLMFLPVFSFAEVAGFNENQAIVFEAIKWSNDFPKNAQVTNAMEYLCKTEDFQLHLMLIQATQNETVFSVQGNSSTLMLIDLDSDAVITYTNCVWPETPEAATKDDMLNMIFACWDSYTLGYNPFLYSEFEITFPLSEEEINGINSALSGYFTKPD